MNIEFAPQKRCSNDLTKTIKAQLNKTELTDWVSSYSKDASPTFLRV